MDVFRTIAGLIGVTAVGAGAFGAHGLASTLDPANLSAFKTAADMQLIHAAVLLALAMAMAGKAHAGGPAFWLIAGGVLLFSGSLYLLTLTPISGIGFVTPIGGLLLMAGWAAIAADGMRTRSSGD